MYGLDISAAAGIVPIIYYQDGTRVIIHIGLPPTAASEIKNKISERVLKELNQI